MIQILHEKDPDKINQTIHQSGLNFDNSDNLRVIVASNDDAPIGYGLYDAENGEILGVSSSEPSMMLPLLKAALNALERAGKTSAFCRNHDLKEILLQARFEEVDGVYTVSLVGYFDVKCHGGK